MVALRILYVDDEPALLELGRLFLEQCGQFTVDTIGSAPAALSLLNLSRYDAIISDYQMPEMNGIELLRKVRTSGNNIPFILFTGRGREEVVIQALNDGADFYLQKGGDPMPQFTELSHKIRQAVQKRLADQMLLESQTQLRTVVDSIQIGIVTIDAKTHRILNANKKAIEMIGADPDSISGQICHKFICPAGIGKCPVTDLGQRVDLSERVLLTQNEGSIPILKSVVSTVLDGKEVLIESFFDISERRRSEKAFQTLIASMVGKSGIESLNEITMNVSKWLGTDITAIMELSADMKHGRILSMQPVSGIIPDGFRPIGGTPCGIVVETGFYLCPNNLRQRFPDFVMPFDFEARSYAGIALRNSTGTVIGAICTFSQNPLAAPPHLQEIFEIIGVKAAAEIERRQAGDMFRQSEERFRVLLENVPGVAVQGYRMDGTTFFWDEGSGKTYGYTAEEAVGRNLTDLIIPPEMRDDVRGAIAYMAQTGEPIPAAELSLMRKDGSRVTVFSSHIILKRPQGEMELYCLDMDLTERRRAEDALRQANLKLNLLSGITRHDIKNKLLVLDGYLGLLREEITDSSLDDYFRQITTTSSGISAMIEFTGEYEKIGVTAPAWQDTRKIVDLAAAKDPLGTIRLENEFPFGTEIFADPLIVRVFYNLMDNAARYGGKITIVRFSEEEQCGNRILVCEDDGNGIPAEEKERIFERGFGKNTGMGLFLVREILSITGITIQETGEPGRGARFEIRVPDGALRAAGK